ncbi:class I SAM-dependent methyltransferase [Aurantiacibacter sp. MUD11]|uniref:class I SAM-dependent methyltransferase n=1 Tax=Aurantiacibacter sp. MUD11 TaxID=3003265 RepID=UPI0022AAC4B9|nr:class I SAM-dependent methyltransferase [Aurantiacibacter sp. MUD11]WAT18802.1 class I SAM-dependent methyltransferase [Aurantiacibacter sp. MUD11]
MTAQDPRLVPPGEHDHSARESTFCRTARDLGLDPDDRWVGGYVDYEWEHLRPVLAAYRIEHAGRTVLEFGCNYGASGIVLARLGAQVTGVDVSADKVRLAQANILLHAMEQSMSAQHVPDTRELPFEGERFEFVIANSVLEYVAPEHLDAVMAEVHRVLRPGGQLLVLGTASRLSPREVHSGRWLVNYLPRAVDRVAGKDLQRGLSPRLLARTLEGRFEVVAKDRWLAARQAVHGKLSLPVRAVGKLAEALGMAPGWLSPNIELLLKRL